MHRGRVVGRRGGRPVTVISIIHQRDDWLEISAPPLGWIRVASVERAHAFMRKAAHLD